MKEIFPGCRRLPLLDNSPTALLHRWLVTLLLSFLFVGKALSQAEEDIPDHKGIWVHDNAGVLSQQTKQYLEQFLQHDRDSTSNQIAVLILKSLNGQDIDDYAFRVFEKWDLGQKGKNNGVLYLIAIDDRKARIEVGEGLEGVLTDLQSSRINRDRVAPYFRQGNFDQGVVAGVKAIRETIRGEYVNENPKQFRKKKRGSSIYTVLIIMAVIFFLSRRRGGRGGGGGYWSSGGGWIIPGGGFGSSSGSWGSGSDFGGGGFSGGGGSSDSW
jgi:uncharacterized protein